MSETTLNDLLVICGEWADAADAEANGRERMRQALDAYALDAVTNCRAIARRADTSPASVSNFFHGNLCVSAATAFRIVDAAVSLSAPTTTEETDDGK